MTSLQHFRFQYVQQLKHVLLWTYSVSGRNLLQRKSTLLQQSFLKLLLVRMNFVLIQINSKYNMNYKKTLIFIINPTSS